MDPARKKEFAIFYIVLAVIAVTFGEGVYYLKTNADQSVFATTTSTPHLAADISANIPVPTITASTTAPSTTIVTTTPVSKPKPKPVPVVVKPEPTSTPAPAPVPTPIPTQVPPSTPIPTKPVPVPDSTPPAQPTSTTPIVPALPYAQSDFTGDKNWSAPWGTMTITSAGSIDMLPKINGTGATVVLKNPLNWSNYTLRANVNWVSGETFGLVADYKDGSDYVECEYDETDPDSIIITLKQYTKGVQTNLAQSGEFIWNDTVRSSVNVSMVVNAGYATCGFDGHSFSNIIPTPGRYLIGGTQTGAVGVTMWDPSPNTAEVIVNSIKVTSNT